MSLVQRVRAAGTRKAGLALAGLLTAGLAAVTGTALASSSSPASVSMPGMTGMTASHSSGATGFTNGWYRRPHRQVLLQQELLLPAATGQRCQVPVRSRDRTTRRPPPPPSTRSTSSCRSVSLRRSPRCSARSPGTASTTPTPSTCPPCSAAGTSDPAAARAQPHRRHRTTCNQSEWWNVDVVGVKSLSAWNKLVEAKSDSELEHLQRTDSAQRDRKHHHQPVPVLLRPPLAASSRSRPRQPPWPGPGPHPPSPRILRKGQHMTMTSHHGLASKRRLPAPPDSTRCAAGAPRPGSAR